MAEEDTDLAQGAEDGTESSTDTAAAALQKKLDKVLKENAEYRQELRTTKISAEFGSEVAELIPENLNLDEAREYAEKLKAFRGEATDQATPADESPEASTEGPTPAERNLAAVSAPSTGTDTPSTRLTISQIDEIARTDPSRAAQLVASGNWQPG